MEPNKFEKHITKALQNREIQPSSNAWERISEQLEEQAPKSKKRSYFWYGIAASFIGILMISVWFFNLKKAANITDIEFVDTQKKTIETQSISSDNKVNRIEEVVVENNTIEEAAVVEVEVALEKQNTFVKDQIASANEVNKLVESLINQTEKLSGFKEEIINNKILEIVATVDSLEQINSVLTDAEVDNLLRNAQKEILHDKLFAQNGSVDAMALLTEVEDELDDSFKDQIFKSLKAKFLKARTALAATSN